MRYDQYRLAGDNEGDAYVVCRRCNESDFELSTLADAVSWAGEHELVCVGDDVK